MLYREFWHTHSRSHIRGPRPPDYPQRFLDAFGFWDHAIYFQSSIARDYRPRWILLPEGDDMARKYSAVFDDFNVFTSLNYYPAPVAAAMRRLTQAEYKLLRMREMPLPRENLERQEALVKSQSAALKRDCFMDLGIDVDMNEKLPSLEAVFDTAKRIRRHFSRRSVPCQVFFSGGKGFHIVASFRCFGQSLAENNHLVNREIMELIQEETGELHHDPAIYSSRRQFRLVNTRHPKSGKHKIFIPEEALSAGLERILALADSPQPAPEPDHAPSEYLAGLYALAVTRVDARKKYSVKKSHVRELESARQSEKPRYGPPIQISGLRHPPCIREALTVGIPDKSTANRNLVTLLLATYFKAIGRSCKETTELLVAHAAQTLSRFSASDLKTIEASTRSAVAAVFRRDQYAFNCGMARRYGFACDDTCELFRKYRDTAVNRKLHRAAGVRALPAADRFPDLDGVRAAMVERIEAYIASANSPPDRFLLIKAPAGSGKTTLTFELLSRNKALRTCWVGSRLDLFDNIPDRFRSRWRRIEGRHGDYTDAAGRFAPANCRRHELAARLRDKRLNVNKMLCFYCPEYEPDPDTNARPCPYHAQFCDGEHNWFIQQSMFLHKAHEFMSGFDIVVFDEDIMSKFIEKIQVRAADAATLLRFTELQIRDMEYVENYRAANGFRKLQPFLRALHAFLSEPPVKESITGDILHRRWDAVCRNTQNASLRALVEAIDVDLDKMMENLDIDVHGDMLPLNFAADLVKVLRFELFERKPDSNLSRLILASPEDKSAFSDAVDAPTLKIFYKVDSPPISKPTIALDATGRESIYSMLFGKPFEASAPALETRNEVIQVFSTSGSKNALQNSKHRARMLDALKSFLDEEPSALVIAKKDLEPAIAPLLPPEAAFTHFFGSRGSNEFLGFKQAVVFGMPGLSPGEILIYASCFYFDRNLRTDTTLIPRTYGGTDSAVKVHCFEEPLIQELQEVFREDEIYQSLHRIRPASDALKRVVLLTNLVLDQLPVTKLVSLDDVAGRKTDVRRDENYSLVREIAELALDKLGFFSTRWNLRFLLDKDVALRPPEEAYLKQAGVFRHVPKPRKLSKRTIIRLVSEIVSELGLERFELKFKTQKAQGATVVFAHNHLALEAAASFLLQFPEAGFLEVNPAENQLEGGGDINGPKPKNAYQ